MENIILHEPLQMLVVSALWPLPKSKPAIVNFNPSDNHRRFELTAAFQPMTDQEGKVAEDGNPE